ncbi:hypothetical protein C8Q76DRAFT_175895 [Earliella scabrosa]|nr:hypothetical protein C8Q76DRAFT_175895 [Earliella scabrosa]
MAFWIGKCRRRRRNRLELEREEAILFPDDTDDSIPPYSDAVPPRLARKQTAAAATDYGSDHHSSYTAAPSSTYSDSAPSHSHLARRPTAPSMGYAAHGQAASAPVPPVPMTAYAVQPLMHTASFAPYPAAGAHMHSQSLSSASEHGTTTGTATETVLSSRSGAAPTATSGRYATAQEEKALIYLSQSGLSTAGGSGSGSGSGASTAASASGAGASAASRVQVPSATPSRLSLANPDGDSVPPPAYMP